MHHKNKVSMKQLSGLCLVLSAAALTACSSGSGDGGDGYDAYALNNLNGVVSLVNFTRTYNPFGLEPSPPTKTIAITGLETGEFMRALDFDPATGDLIGFSSKGKIYIVDTETGAAAAKVTVNKQDGTPYFTGDLADIYDIDIDPTTGRLWIVSTGVTPNGTAVSTPGTSISVDLSTGVAVASPSFNGYLNVNTAFGTSASTLTSSRGVPGYRAAAFSSNAQGACQSTLYGLSTGFNGVGGYYANVTTSNFTGTIATETDRLFVQDTSGIAGTGLTRDIFQNALMVINGTTTIPDPNVNGVWVGDYRRNADGTIAVNASGTAIQDFATSLGFDIVTDANGVDSAFAVIVLASPAQGVPGSRVLYSVDLTGATRIVRFYNSVLQSISGGFAIRPPEDARPSGC